MSQVSEVIQEFEGLIHYAARRYGADDHPMLNYADMAQEGWLVLSKLINKHCDDGKSLNIPKEHFNKVFKTALFNQMKTMLEAHRYTQKRVVSLVELNEEIMVTPFDEVAYSHYIHHVRQILSHNPPALSVFNNLLDPAEPIVDLALNEAKRRDMKKTRQLRQRGVATVTVTHAHIRRYLRLPQETFNTLLHEVKTAVQTVTCERVVSCSV